MQTLSVVKIGGNIVNNPEALQTFLADFAALSGPKVLVHGGGNLATELAEKLDISVEMHNGRRITGPEMLKVAVMVYAGYINKSITAALQALGCNAIGLCGPDAGLITARKRNPEPVNYGFVGDVEAVNAPFLQSLFAMGLSPVMAPVTADLSVPGGQLLNTNADTIAAESAAALSPFFRVNLIYCFEKPGVLLDVSKPESVIKELNRDLYQTLRAEGAIHSGMLPKLESAFESVRRGVAAVRITNGLSKPGTLIA